MNVSQFNITIFDGNRESKLPNTFVLRSDIPPSMKDLVSVHKFYPPSAGSCRKANISGTVTRPYTQVEMDNLSLQFPSILSWKCSRPVPYANPGVYLLGVDLLL